MLVNAKIHGGLTGTGDSWVPPGRALHHPGPEDRRPARQLRQRLGVAWHRGAEVHPGGGGQAVYPGKAGEQLSSCGDGSPQDVADAVRGGPGELGTEVGQLRCFESRRALLQGVREQRRLHLGHVVQRRQRGAA